MKLSFKEEIETISNKQKQILLPTDQTYMKCQEQFCNEKKNVIDQKQIYIKKGRNKAQQSVT